VRTYMCDSLHVPCSVFVLLSITVFICCYLSVRVYVVTREGSSRPGGRYVCVDVPHLWLPFVWLWLRVVHASLRPVTC
jgi:hypothetical protein